jgi:hypothetical protein
MIGDPDYKPWTRWNEKGKTLCYCGKAITTKPAEHCSEPRHVASYKRNVVNITRNRAEAQLEAFIHYSGHNPPQCVLCEFKDIRALQLDHEKGDGAEFRRLNKYATGKSLCLFLRKRGWPDGYRILCANCQCIERERLGFNGGGANSK